MAHPEAHAWWADVQHLRGAAERTDEARRRADQADLAARRAAREHGRVDTEFPPRRREESGGRARRGYVVDAGPRRGGYVQEPTPPRGEQIDDPMPRRSGRVEDPMPRRSGRVEEPIARRSHALASVPRRPDGAAVPERRTVEIRGRTVPAPAVPRSVELERHQRPARRAVERVGPRPDRIALWALVMGVLLIMVAVGTADAAVL